MWLLACGDGARVDHVRAIGLRCSMVAVVRYLVHKYGSANAIISYHNQHVNEKDKGFLLIAS